MNPSSFRMRAISSLMFETGTSTFWCFAAYALRMRVSMSAIGSVITSPQSDDECEMMNDEPSETHHSSLTVHRFALPARLRDAGDVAFERQRAEADAAERELAQVAAPAAAAAA